MNDKKVDFKSHSFEVTGILNRIVLDSGNNPIDGIVIYFTSQKGITGSIEIPMKQYTKEKAMILISKKVEQLEELLS